MALFRLSEWVKGYVRVEIIHDTDKRVLRELAAKGVSLWDIRSQQDLSYSMNLLVSDIQETLRVVKSVYAKVRFSEKKGLPFVIWHAKRRKVFFAGAVFFVVMLYMLSGFIWHVDITGTDHTEEVDAALKKLNIYSGSMLFKVMEQDEVQLALLDLLPKISWVGVKIQGTSVFIKVIPRIASVENKVLLPQNIVASVPGVIANVLASSGQVTVKSGEYVSPGKVLISGMLDNGENVHASGKVEAIVWYRTELTMPMSPIVNRYTGQFSTHDYLVFGNFPVLVWGFSHPPYKWSHVSSVEEPLQLGPYKLPISWRVNKVYEVVHRKQTLSVTQAIARGMHYAAADVQRVTPEGTRLIRQNVLQRKEMRGNLYLTVWSEVLEDIGKAQTIPKHSGSPVKG